MCVASDGTEDGTDTLGWGGYEFELPTKMLGYDSEKLLFKGEDLGTTATAYVASCNTDNGAGKSLGDHPKADWQRDYSYGASSPNSKVVVCTLLPCFTLNSKKSTLNGREVALESVKGQKMWVRVNPLLAAGDKAWKVVNEEACRVRFMAVGPDLRTFCSKVKEEYPEVVSYLANGAGCSNKVPHDDIHELTKIIYRRNGTSSSKW